MKLCESEKCSGCFACVNICPKHCLSMVEEENGHVYPKCDLNECIHCGLCAKVCQGLHPVQQRKPLHTYAAWNLNLQEQNKSSSGGLSALLAEELIKNNGVVYGAAFDGNWNVEHTRCEDKNTLNKICKSKYVQSWINDNFIKIKEDLKQGKKVMFAGTPCQVAGLKSYLLKDYENLLTVNLVCHGVPSRKLYREEINRLARVDGLSDIHFRGRYGFGFGFYYDDNRVEVYSIRYNYYMRGFMDGLFYRESCYQCPYANPKRVGDISLGDFWGIGKTEEFDNPERRMVSMVLVNTERGQQYFNAISPKIYFRERSLEEAVAGNPQLHAPSKKPKQYALFLKLYPKKGLRKAAERCYPKMALRLYLEKIHLWKVKK